LLAIAERSVEDDDSVVFHKKQKPHYRFGSGVSKKFWIALKPDCRSASPQSTAQQQVDQNAIHVGTSSPFPATGQRKIFQKKKELGETSTATALLSVRARRLISEQRTFAT
jgi:hypothetical protein